MGRRFVTIRRKQKMPNTFVQKMKPLGRMVFLLLLSLASYRGSLDNPFHYDDIHSIVENPHIRELGNIPFFFVRPEYFSADARSAMYRPLVLVSYAINYAIGGYDVVSYHWLNWALHGGCSLMVYVLLRRLPITAPAAIWTSAIFALHPINSEAVNYISSRSESLCALFFLISLLGRSYWMAEGKRGWGGYVISLVAYSGALLAKSVAIVLPAVLLLWEFTLALPEKRKISYRRLLYYHGPFWIVAGFYLLLVRSFLLEALVDTPVRSFDIQVGTQLKALVYYGKLLGMPVGLSIEHQFKLIENLLSALPLLALLLAIGVGIWGWEAWRVRREWCFWAGFPLIVLLPTFIVPLNVLVNEHRLYLAAIPMATLLATGLTGLMTRWRRTGIVVGGVLLLIFGRHSAQRTLVWQDSEELWRDALAAAPLMPRPHIYVGDFHKRRGENELALREYQRALDVYPQVLSGNDRLVVYNNMGATLLAMGRNLAAIEAYREALSLDSTYTRSRQALEGLVSLEEDTWEPEAKKLYRRGVMVGLVQGDLDQGLLLFWEALKIQVRPEIYLSMAMAFERKNDLDSALKAYETLCVVAPQSNYCLTARNKIAELRQFE